MTPKVVRPVDGMAGFIGSIGVRFMIDGEDSGGGFSLVEHPMSPRALGAPLHRHSREDEYSYVTPRNRPLEIVGQAKQSLLAVLKR